MEHLVKSARRKRPAFNRALLDHIGVREAVVEDWPDGVMALYIADGRHRS